MQKALLTTLVVFLSNIAAGQSGYIQTGLNSYDVPADARSVAMGESFVALTGNRDAIMYNPAGLGSIRGMHVSYSQRRLDWTSFIGDFKYHQVSGTVQTPLVNLGFLYNRFNQNNVTFYSSSGSGTGDLYDYVLALCLARRIAQNWDVGVSLKTFDLGLNKLNGDVPQLQTSRPILIDVGCIYNNEIASSLESFTQSFSLGIAFQNIGGTHKTSSAQLGGPDFETHLPKYIRAGFAYRLVINGLNDESPKPFSMLVTGEYRTFTNGETLQSLKKDYWGFGVELTGIEIVSLRLSGFITPLSSVYGTRGAPALRYGLGIALPFQRLGWGVPVLVGIDYAGIPPVLGGFFSGSDVNTMRLFSFSVSYENELF